MTIVENFGITYFENYFDGMLPELSKGNFYGGILNDTIYGYLLAKKQKINWDEFYPLHIGDFWKYEGNSGSIRTINTVEVVEDTLIQGNVFKKLLSIDYTFNSRVYSYERLDNNILYNWRSFDSTVFPTFKFSSCLGDTFTINPNNNSSYRIDDKDYNTLKMFLYPDLIFYGQYFSRGLGLVSSTIEGGGNYLVGAIINGKVFGDMTITEVENIITNKSKEFLLFQNYPNPFNSTTTISYSLPKAGLVTIKIYNVLGSEVITLINEEKSAGTYHINFDGRNLSSGVYFYSIKAGNVFQTKKMVLTK